MALDLANITEISQEMYATLSPEEKAVVKKILTELSETGKSETLHQIYLADYKEIPVDIITFVKDFQYLGKAWHLNDGTCKLFPFWENKLREIFPDNITTNFNTVILSGARGLGKSEIAITIGCYLMYRLMCLKDPYTYLNLKPTEKVAFAFVNITEELAYDIGVNKFQNTVQASPWFMERGSMSGTKNLIWNPPEFIHIIIGSQPRHVIGQPIFYCVDAETVVLTDNGPQKIKNLVDKKFKVLSINNSGNVEYSNECTAKITNTTDLGYRLTFYGGSSIDCTAEHRFLLSSGKYKQASELLQDDILFSGSRLLKLKVALPIKFENQKSFYDIINAAPYNNFIIKLREDYICAHNCFADEISFIANKSVDEQKKKAIDIVDTALGGMKTRFTNRGKNPTVMVLASSKRSEKSFLEEHMKKKMKTDKEKTFIVDEPVWNVRPPSEYSGNKFYVAQGNRFLASEVLPDGVDHTYFINKGYKILEVPVEYKANFLEDIDRALCDYAGVSSSDITKYISAARLQTCKKPELVNPFEFDIIEVGNALDDKQQYYDFFDLGKVDPILFRKPMYLHMDLSVSGDKTGIAGVCIVGKKPPTEGVESANDLRFRLAFSVSIKAPKGHQISFEKNRQFVYWLRERGFNIRGVSTDSFQSVDTGQQLSAKGFEYKMISVDRVDHATKICKPYQYLRSSIYEERLDMYDSPLLTEEFLQLERDSSGHITHENQGQTGSKDAIDAICGATYNASQHADEYAYDYGEDADIFSEINSGVDYKDEFIKNLGASLLQQQQQQTSAPQQKSASNKVRSPMAEQQQFDRQAVMKNAFDQLLSDDDILMW